MSSRLPVLVALVTIAAALAGCAGPSGSTGEQISQATLAPGTSANLALVLENATKNPGNGTVTVVDSGEVNVTAPDQLASDEAGALAGWLEVRVPEGASNGTTDVVLDVGPAADARRVSVSVDVQPVDERLRQGTVAMVDLTARNEEGEVALTTNETVATSPLAKAEDFREPRSFGPAPIQLSSRSQLPGSLVSAVAHSGVNHSLSVDVPNAFGPEFVEQNVSREETIERERTDRRSLDLPRRQARGIVGPDAEEGDPVELPGSQLPYAIEKLNRTHVRIQVNVTEGDNVTVYPAWPNASQVVNVTEDNVTFHTDPPVEPGEIFTWRSSWPNATEIVEETNSTIVLRHTPEVGTTYTTQTRRGQSTEVTVEDVRSDRIVISQENPNPLAGQEITFDVTIVDQRAPQQARGTTPRSR